MMPQHDMCDVMCAASLGIDARTALKVSVFTGGSDPHYAIPLISSLAAHSTAIDVIGSDEYLQDHILPIRENITFYNVHGGNPGSRLYKKVCHVLATYARLIKYAARSDSDVFHILWLNKLQTIDRLFLITYFRLLGKTLVFTAHNVDASQRDGTSSVTGRLTLRFMYRMMDRVFVHTRKMKSQLEQEFKVDPRKITVIPYGLNTLVPESDLTSAEARRRLDVGPNEKTLLLFGNITPYKGLEYVIRALAILKQRGVADLRLIIAGRVKDRRSRAYHTELNELIEESGVNDRILSRIEFIPDRDIEVYFKAADVCVLPYTTIFQSGVLFLAYRFGVPVIATDVGSLREDVIEGRTGFICRPQDSANLAETIQKYFCSDLHRDPEHTRRDIRKLASAEHSWPRIAGTTVEAYCAASGRGAA